MTKLKCDIPLPTSQNPKVLVVRLITDRKQYCIKELIDTSKSLTYKNHKVIHIDNSADEFLKESLEDVGLTVIKTEHFMKDANGKYIYNTEAQEEKDKKKRKVLPVREMMIRDMNLARDLVIGQDYDYMLILEQDIIPHPDIIEKLLSYKQHIMSAFYWLDMKPLIHEGRAGWWTPVNYYVFKITNEGDVIRNTMFEPNPKEVYFPSGPFPYAHAGFGCTLVSKEVLKKIKFRYDPERAAQVDAFFCMDSIKAGFIPMVTTEIIVGHLHEDWDAKTKV